MGGRAVLRSKWKLATSLLLDAGKCWLAVAIATEGLAGEK